MALAINIQSDTVTITLDSRFDFDFVEEFRRAYSDNIGKFYIVDFRHTDYMDSSGLGMLLNMRRHVNGDSSAIKLINCRPQVKRVLLISRFETEFIID